MTPAEGFGMLIWSLSAMAVGVTILYIVINKIQNNEQEEKDKKKREEMFKYFK